MIETPRPRKKVVLMKNAINVRLSARMDTEKVSEFIESAQMSMLVAVFELFVLLALHRAGVALSPWMTHPLCLSFATAYIVYCVAMWMNYRMRNTIRRASEAHELKQAKYESLALAKDYKHDA